MPGAMPEVCLRRRTGHLALPCGPRGRASRELQSLSGRRQGVVVFAVFSEGNNGAATMQAQDGGMGSAEGQGGAAGGAGAPGGPIGPRSWRDTRADGTAAGVAPQLEGTLIILEQGGEAQASGGGPERQVLELYPSQGAPRVSGGLDSIWG